MINIDIKKDKRSSKYHQRGIRNGEVSKCRKLALQDISKHEECNYVSKEYLVLKMLKFYKGQILKAGPPFMEHQKY